MNPNNKDTEEKIEKLLVNGLLLCGLRGHDNIEDKLRNLQKYIKQGADVNAPDANDANNTPLHIAIEKDEPEVVEFLLHMGATHAINTKKQTPIDLAKLSNNTNKSIILNILKANSIPKELNLDNTTDTKKIKRKKQSVEKVIIENKTALTNEKRTGTSGISGQLYETKLIGLLLHRALNDQNIDKFYLGSNIPELGAFDDIVFKYYLKNDIIPKIFFIQAKHRDIKSKDKLTVNSVLKANGDFSLDKYFESYLNVRRKLDYNKSKNVMFQKETNLDCTFIIYTSASENFHKKKAVECNGKENLVITGVKGKTFKFDYDDGDIELLWKNTLMSQIKSLAKTFAEYIVRHKYKNMLWNELIKVYHVYLAHNVVQVSNEETYDYTMGRFRKSFLESNNEIFVLMKEKMFKELKLHDKLSTNSIDVTLEFKLPKKFGNSGVLFNEEEIINLRKIIVNLIELRNESNNKTTIVIDDDMVGPKKVLKKTDITMIGNLVGDALTLDNKTGLLKFNMEGPSLESARILEALRLNENDLKNLRFNINVKGFPQLSLSIGKPIKNLLVDFLDKIIFYTNQEDEEGVERILKHEINDRYITDNKNNDSLYLIRGDAIYLQYHDKIQKWWKNQNEVLSHTCKFYEEAKKVILDSPLLNIYSEAYIKKMIDHKLSFAQKAVTKLRLGEFMGNSKVPVYNICTKNKTLTSIKVIQYFRDAKTLNNYKFIDLDIVREKDYELILSETSDMIMDVIIIVSNKPNNLTNVLSFIHKIAKKIILISHLSHLTEKVLVNTDESNNFSDLNMKTILNMYEHRSFFFQGSEVPFHSIVDINMQKYLRDEMLLKITSNDIIEIGKEPTSVNAFNENNKYYVPRNLCRCLQLDETSCNGLKVYDLTDQDKQRPTIENNTDSIIIANDNAEFEAACKELNNYNNIHWFYRDNESQILWKKSLGSIEKLIPHVKRIKCDKTCLVEPKSLKHLNERVVVIIAEPGMGKSTLLTHLLIQTKNLFKNMCIIKFNLLDLKQDYSSWAKCDVGQKMNLMLLILYKTFSAYDKKNSTCDEEFLKDINLIQKDGAFYVSLNEVNQTNLDSKDFKNAYNVAMFELQTFVNMYNNGNISLILDGFDEVCPNYKNETIEIFKLLKISRVQYLWITSRSYMIISELESELDTFSFTLKSLTFFEQIDFLQNNWPQLIRSNAYISINIYLFKNLISRFLDDISIRINDHKRDFTGTPLHLRMIAETNRDYFIRLYLAPNLIRSGPTTVPWLNNEFFNLITLYEEFIEIKFQKIRFDEKNSCLCSKNPDIKMVIDRERILFIETHKVLAAYALFGANVGILTKEELKRVSDFIQGFTLGKEKTGIIGKIDGNEPKFVHFTYAEYFACEFLCDKLKENNESACNFFISDILASYNRTNIRNFINAKFEIDTELSDFTSHHICNALLMQNDSDKFALHNALFEKHINIAFFIMNNLEKHINKDNLDDFIDLVSNKHQISAFSYCTNQTASKTIVDIFAKIIEIIKRLDFNKLAKLFFYNDIPIYNLFSIAFLNRHELGKIKVNDHIKHNMDKILEHTNAEIMTNLLTTPLMGARKATILHVLFDRNNDMNMLKYIERLDQNQRMLVFSARDYFERVPAHYAAMTNNYDFFDIMANLLTKEQFKTVCLLKDNDGLIALIGFIDDAHKTDRFNALCFKVGLNFC